MLVEHFTNLTHLEDLQLRSVTAGSGLSISRGNCKLRSLKFEDGKITDAGMACLGKMNQLESLSLANTEITDAGLAHLGGLRRSRTLDLGCPDCARGNANNRNGTEMPDGNARA